MVEVDTQDELDRICSKAAARPEACGWPKDRYGASWQITPRRLNEMMRDPDLDRAAAKRAAEAMMQMVKRDTAEIEKAFGG